MNETIRKKINFGMIVKKYKIVNDGLWLSLDTLRGLIVECSDEVSKQSREDMKLIWQGKLNAVNELYDLLRHEMRWIPNNANGKGTEVKRNP